MNFLNNFKEKAKKLEKTIGIGLSKEITINNNIIQTAEKIVKLTNNKIVLVGVHDIIETLKNTTQKLDSNLKFIADSDHANYLTCKLFEKKT